MEFCPDFATNSRKEWRVSLFQSNLRKQIRKLPKILKSVKIIHYYFLVFIIIIRVLRRDPDEAMVGPVRDEERPGPARVQVDPVRAVQLDRVGRGSPAAEALPVEERA